MATDRKTARIKQAGRAAEALRQFSITSIFLSMLAALSRLTDRLDLTILAVPLLILSFTLKSILAVIEFATAKNKNLPKFAKIFAMLGLLTLSILFIPVLLTMYQGGISLLITLGVLSSGIIALDIMYRFTRLIFNLTRALLAPPNSIERKAYLQEVVKSALNIVLASTVLLLLFMPFSSSIGIALLSAVVLHTLATITWQFSSKLRHSVKSFFHLEKPDVDMKVTPTPSISPTQPRTALDTQFEKKHYNSIFKRAYRKDVVAHYIQQGNKEHALTYLKEQLTQKIAQYDTPELGEKQLAKKESLLEAQSLLNKGDIAPDEIDNIINNHPLSEQSFFANVSDTVDLLQAIKSFLTLAPTNLTLANTV